MSDNDRKDGVNKDEPTLLTGVAGDGTPPGAVKGKDSDFKDNTFGLEKTLPRMRDEKNSNRRRYIFFALGFTFLLVTVNFLFPEFFSEDVPDSSVSQRNRRTEQKTLVKKQDCGLLLKQLEEKGELRLEYGEKLVMANCKLFAGYPGIALKLVPDFSKVFSSRQFDWQGSHLTNFYLYARAKNLMWRGEETVSGIDKFCPRWVDSPACLARLIALAQQGYGMVAENGFRIIEPNLKKYGKPLQALAWMAAGQAASSQGKYTQALKRLRLAERQASLHPPMPLKDILEAQAYTAYYFGNRKAAEEVRLRATRKLPVLEPSPLAKLQVLDELMGSGARNALVRIFTSSLRETPFFTDPEFFEIISTEGLRRGMVTQYQRYYDFVAETVQQRFEAPKGELKKIRLWRIRSLLAEQSYQQARVRLNGYAKDFGVGPAVLHLEATTLINLGRSNLVPEAIRQLKKAIQLQPNWQSQWALAYSYLRMRRFKDYTRAVGGLDVRQRDISKWVTLLAIQHLMAQGKYGNALEKLDIFLKKHPEIHRAWALKSAVLKRIGKEKQLAEFITYVKKQKLDGQLILSQDDPLGPFAMNR